MSLVFAAMCPHTPLLIPAIGKEKLELIEKTKQAMERLEQELYLTKPHIVAVISPHSSIFRDAFSINAHTHFTSSFELFGDLSTKRSWSGAPDLAATISHEAKKVNVPIQLVSEEALDYGATTPLSYLTNHLPDVKILPIGYSALDADAHMEFGRLLKEVFMASNKRIAIIASGDLSHCLSPESPAGYKPEGKQFDDACMRLLSTRKLNEFKSLDPSLVATAEECGYRSALIVSSMLEHIEHRFETYSYEYPFGVGYLVGHFAF